MIGAAFSKRRGRYAYWSVGEFTEMKEHGYLLHTLILGMVRIDGDQGTTEYRPWGKRSWHYANNLMLAMIALYKGGPTA